MSSTVTQIIVNGETVDFESEQIAYGEILELAGFGARRDITVSYTNGGGALHPSGLVCPDCTLIIQNGTVINADDTSNA